MIKTIYHLADIHITNNETRHVEYEQVFQNLYSILEKDKDNKLIVICGDLFHEKNSHQNKQNILAKNFINKLSSYAEIVIIDGNHDYIPHNDNSSSSVNSLLHHLQVVNKVHYLTENKIYKIHNVNFGLTTMNTDKVTHITNKNQDELYIALYHGSLYKSVTDLGWVNDDEKSFKTSDFKDYDMTMLGDIHKFSYLNKEKTIAYSSSLIQQNFGETISNHGMIKWNLETKKGDFIEVPNDYVFKVHTIKDINNYEISDIDNKKTRLKIIYKNQKKEDLDKYIKEINKKYNIINLRREEQYDEKNTITKDGKIINKNILEVYDEYIQEYKLINDNEIKSRISKCIDKYNIETNHNIKNLKLKTLEFENLFTYGSSNFINFESLEGLNILTGANGLGKSSIVDVILFTIFNTFSRGKGKEALNIRHEKGMSKLTLELNGENYTITRKIQKTRTDVELLKNGKTITSDTKNSTDELIVKIFGKYQDMIMSSIILQVGQNFIDMADKDKKTTLINILGLDIYENIYSKCKEKKRKLASVQISDLNKQITDVDYQKLIGDKKLEVKETEEILETIENEKTKLMEEYYSIQKNIDNDVLTIDKVSLENKIKEQNNKILEYESLINKNKFKSNTIQELSNKKEEILENNDLLNKEINEYHKQIIKTQKININPKTKELLDKEIKVLNDELEKTEIEIMEIKMEYNINDNYDEQIKNLENETAEYKKTLNKRDNDKKILLLLESKNKYLLEHKFNSKCKSCENNKEIHKNIGYLEEIEKIKEEIKSFNDNIDISKNEEMIKKIKEIKENKNKITLLKSKKDLVNKKIIFEEKNIEQSKINEKIEKQNEMFQKEINDKEKILIINKKEYTDIIQFTKIFTEYENTKSILTKNNNLLDKINMYDKELIKINEIKKTKEELNKKNEFYKKKIFTLHSELTNLVSEEKNQDKLKKELENKFKKINILDKTEKFFKNGFREYIYKNKAILLEKKINNVLMNLANYEISIDTSDNDISFYKIIKNKKITNVKKTKSKIKIIEDNDVTNEETKLLNVRELCGFERVSFNIALRVALNSMNIINKNNFIIIDEGFSACDEKNITNVSYLLEILKKEYDICIIITHINEIKNINERKIEITRDTKTTDSKIYVE